MDHVELPQNENEVVTVPVRFDPLAHKVAIALSQSEQFLGKTIRVYVCGKDCDGFMYGVNFDERLADDTVFMQDTLPILIDPATLKILENAVVEYVDDERGRGFVVTNPKQSQFRGKFWRKKPAGSSPAL